MGWRSALVTNPSQLRLENGALVIAQEEGTARLMLEDLSVVVLETPRAVITSALLSACAQAQVALVTVDERHMPNGVLMPFQGHSRALRVLKAQLALGVPARKRLRQRIIQSKVRNQAAVLRLAGQGETAGMLDVLAQRVRSGDPGNIEARAAQAYFRALFGKDFARHQVRWVNAALDYGYAIFRAVLARDLAAHGFATALGLFHCSELNAFNLADDLLEPYRPVVDARVLRLQPSLSAAELTTRDKAELVRNLHADVAVENASQGLGARTALSAMQATVSSLSSLIIEGGQSGDLVLPGLLMDGSAEVSG
jgi:CRISPR-associated protein Cas1